ACPAPRTSEFGEYLREVPGMAYSNCVHDAECFAGMSFQGSKFVKAIKDFLVVRIKLADHFKTKYVEIKEDIVEYLDGKSSKNTPGWPGLEAPLFLKINNSELRVVDTVTFPVVVYIQHRA